MHQERAFLDVAVQGAVDLAFCRLSFVHDYGKTTAGGINGFFDGNLVSADSGQFSAFFTLYFIFFLYREIDFIEPDCASGNRTFFVNSKAGIKLFPP